MGEQAGRGMKRTNLQGRTALITGGGQGVGLGIAKVLADQGAAVAVNDIVGTRAESALEQLLAQGAQACSCVFDVRELSAVSEGVSKACRDLEVENFDILVNNAGNAGNDASGQGTMQLKSFLDLEPEDWQPFLEVNLHGLLHCLHAVLPGMQRQGWGRVVLISSEAGRVGSAMGFSVYGAAKAAGAGLLRHVACELGPAGITANTISLGLMNNVPEDFSRRLVRSIPARRLGTPEDAGHLVAFLASEQAAWINGETIAANGGNYAI